MEKLKENVGYVIWLVLRILTVIVFLPFEIMKLIADPVLNFGEKVLDWEDDLDL